MNYKIPIGAVVALKDKLYLGDAVVVGYRNATYVLEFQNDHAELKDIRFPFSGGRRFRGLHAAEHQLQEMVTHYPERQTWTDPMEAHHKSGNWLLDRFTKKE